MCILSNYYFHFDLELNENQKKKFNEYIEEYLKNLSKVIYKQNVDVHIQIENGSIKTWILLLGSLYIAIGNYGSFRAGIDQLISDSKIINKIIINDFYKNGIKQNIILKNKRELAIPDRIRKVLLQIDRFEKNYNSKSIDEKEIQKIIYKLKRILTQIDNKEDFDLIRNGIKSQHLPNLNFIENKQSSDFDKIRNNIKLFPQSILIDRIPIYYKKEEDYLLPEKNE